MKVINSLKPKLYKTDTTGKKTLKTLKDLNQNIHQAFLGQPTIYPPMCKPHKGEGKSMYLSPNSQN